LVWPDSGGAVRTPPLTGCDVTAPTHTLLNRRGEQQSRYAE
jgi:hypothetical protein